MVDTSESEEVGVEPRVSKRKFISAVARRAGVSVRVASEVYEALLEELLVTVSSGQKLMLTGFGSFYKQIHKGHKVQFAGSKTGKKIEDYSVLKFSATRKTNQRLDDDAAQNTES